MKKYDELSYTERKEVAELFANWLKNYTDKVVKKVMAKSDEILNNDYAMNMLKELKQREEKEAKHFDEEIRYLFEDFKTFEDFDVHNNVFTYSDSYRNVLYDLYIN